MEALCAMSFQELYLLGSEDGADFAIESLHLLGVDAVVMTVGPTSLVALGSFIASGFLVTLCCFVALSLLALFFALSFLVASSTIAFALGLFAIFGTFSFFALFLALSFLVASSAVALTLSFLALCLLVASSAIAFALSPSLASSAVALALGLLLAFYLVALSGLVTLCLFALFGAVGGFVALSPLAIGTFNLTTLFFELFDVLLYLLTLLQEEIVNLFLLSVGQIDNLVDAVGFALCILLSVEFGSLLCIARSECNDSQCGQCDVLKKFHSLKIFKVNMSCLYFFSQYKYSERRPNRASFWG